MARARRQRRRSQRRPHCRAHPFRARPTSYAQPIVGIGSWIDRTSRAGHHRPLYDVAAADHADRHHRQPGVDRDDERAFLEAADPPVDAARAFGEHDQRVGFAHQPPHLLDDVGSRVLAVHQQMAGPVQVPAQERDRAERRLGEFCVQRDRANRSDFVELLVVGRRLTRRGSIYFSTMTETHAVVFRISEDQVRAHQCPVSPDRSNSVDTIEMVPRTMV